MIFKGLEKARENKKCEGGRTHCRKRRKRECLLLAYGGRTESNLESRANSNGER